MHYCYTRIKFSVNENENNTAVHHLDLANFFHHLYNKFLSMGKQFIKILKGVAWGFFNET